MRLITTPASPFGRKVRVVAAEKGLADRIEIAHDNPWKPDTRVPEMNPVGKVPVLVTDDNIALYDSTVISEYLDSLHDRNRLFPAAGPARWIALRRQQLADHLLDSFIAVRLERNRPAGEQSPGWIARQRTVVQRCVDAMETDAAQFGEYATIGHIACAVALGHLDFRHPTGEPDWRDGRATLTAWYTGFAERPSMTSTAPHD